MKCPQCGFENKPNKKYCTECGARLSSRCPECNAEVEASEKFCGECGHDLGKPTESSTPIDYSQPQSYTPKYLADKILTTRSSIEGERKLVTVLFADVANYTSIAERLDPEEVHQIMDGCFEIVMDEIHEHEGTINQFTGDGVMALFGAPVAHEDHAQRACYAALAIQRAVASYGEKVRQKHGEEFQMRIGLNSGPVIVGSIGDDLRMDYTAVGDTTNLAARIQQAAEAGEVWMSQDTRNLVKDYLQHEAIGELALKGKAQAQMLYRVLSDRPDVRTRFEAGLLRGVTELVGRRAEMASLRATLERAKGGEAQLVDIVGEPGVGKTRLVYEFRKTLGSTVTFLSGVCIPYGRNINFFPLIDLVRRAFGIEEGMSEADVRNRVREGAGLELGPRVPFYEYLLALKVEDPEFNALNPEVRKYGTFEAAKDLLLARTEEKPLVVFLEDAQWMDRISEEFFTYFARCLHDHKVLMLAAYRPEGSPPWAQGTSYQRLGLETLNWESSIRLVRNILGGGMLDPGLEARIAEKTEGNPFFVEEIIRELMDRGDLEKEDHHYLCKRPVEQIDIPSTIQGVLSARMDRLSEDLKRTMQVASVIGRDFAYRILKSIMELGEELRTHLSNLVGLEVLYEKAMYPELEYIFKHALTQEVAYESLLKHRRRKIHGRVARTIEGLYAGSLEEHYELLAHHYGRSEDAEKAVHYFVLAGEKSEKVKAADAICRFFTKALKRAEVSNIALNPQTTARIHNALAWANSDIGQMDVAWQEAQKGIEISRQYGMIELEREGLTASAGILYMVPMKAEEVDQHFEDAIARAQEIGHRATESAILGFKGLHECSKGHVYQGYLMIIDAERAALEAGDSRALLSTRFCHLIAEKWVGTPKVVIDLTEGLVDAFRAEFNLIVFGTGAFIRGIALAEIGRISEGLALIKDGIDVCEKFGGLVSLGRLSNCLGYCYSEIYHPEMAKTWNMRSEKIGRELIERQPTVRTLATEWIAQANVNLMENLFDQGEVDAAWDRMVAFEQESRSDDFGKTRFSWETRMHYLASQILLLRNELGKAETLVQQNLERARKEHLKKNEGRFMRILGEIRMKSNQPEQAITTLRESIRLLAEVGNRRQLWMAHSSLASAFTKLGRSSEAREHWGAAAHEIGIVATSGLSDPQLRDGFVSSRQIREILSEAES